MAVDDLLIKLAKNFAKQKLQTVFLINNYDMTITVLKVGFCQITIYICINKKLRGETRDVVFIVR